MNVWAVVIGTVISAPLNVAVTRWYLRRKGDIPARPAGKGEPDA